jgi:4-amino-4-deoxy-L-arabinose transferase-like glycosyltransferase
MMSLLSLWGFFSRRANGFFIALALITLIGAGLRLIKLGEYPGGFGQDEAINLYDAWSLLATGADHHGARWPLNSRQFGDSPSTLPSYLTMPFVVLFGPTEFATRLPCALLNVAAIPLIGLLMFHLFKNRAAGVFAATLLAVSPWNIYFSRWAVSPGFVTFYQVAGMCLMIRLLTGQNHRIRVYGSAILTGFILFLWTHQYLSQYLFAPFMIGVGLLLWSKTNWPRILLTGGVYSAFILLAILTRAQDPATLGRLQSECVFFDDHILKNLWHNYWDYQSFTYLFHAPSMPPLHQIPGVPLVQHSLAPFYSLGLATLLAAILIPGRLLALLGQTNTPDDIRHWRRAALWMLAGFLLAPITGAVFTQKMYTARMTHLLTQVLLITSVGCATVWYLLRRIPLHIAAPVFAILLALYLGHSTVKTFKGLARNSIFLKEHLQQGVPDVMRYLARQPNVHSVRFPRMMQGYIYHLCFTPITPAQLTRLNISRLSSNPEERWRYARINQIGSYWFNQELDDVEIAKTCSLRHQVRDNECIWYDLYERNGDWFVLRHPETR